MINYFFHFCITYLGLYFLYFRFLSHDEGLCMKHNGGGCIVIEDGWLFVLCVPSTARLFRDNRESNPGPSHDSPLHNHCTTQAPQL